MFHRLSKHLEFRQKYSAGRRIFNSLLGVWISWWNTVARVWYITYQSKLKLKRKSRNKIMYKIRYPFKHCCGHDFLCKLSPNCYLCVLTWCKTFSENISWSWEISTTLPSICLKHWTRKKHIILLLKLILCDHCNSFIWCHQIIIYMCGTKTLEQCSQGNTMCEQCKHF